MTSHPTCCHPEDSVETALQLMKDKRVRRLPVVDQQMQLEGMLSISDFIRREGVNTTATYYIKTAAVDVRKAMATLENHVSEVNQVQSDTNGTPGNNSTVEPSTIQ
jgi:CBS-domain-containing membrane protein